MNRPLLAPLMLAGLLAGCATSSLTLLPTEEGKQGAVALLDEKNASHETVVNELNSRTNLSGQPHTRSIDPARMSAREQGLLAQLPPAPVHRALYFQEGTTNLVPESQSDFDFLKAEIARRPGAAVQVTGYTDTVGTMEYNDDLSQRRAEEILKALATQGIELDMLSAVGRGERELAVPTADNVPNQTNRRVVVTVR